MIFQLCKLIKKIVSKIGNESAFFGYLNSVSECNEFNTTIVKYV